MTRDGNTTSVRETLDGGGQKSSVEAWIFLKILFDPYGLKRLKFVVALLAAVELLPTKDLQPLSGTAATVTSPGKRRFVPGRRTI